MVEADYDLKPIDNHVHMQLMKDTNHVQLEGISLPWHQVWHRYRRPKALILRCAVLCSITNNHKAVSLLF